MPTETENTVEIGGITIQLAEDFKCKSNDVGKEITVKSVGAFHESVAVSEVLNNLVRRAQIVGADTISNVRIDIAKSQLGVTATALAMECGISPTQSDKSNLAAPFSDSVIQAIARTTNCAVYSFTISKAPPDQRVTALAPKVLLGNVDQSSCARIRTIVTSADSYNADRSTQSSCPFLPTKGIAFSDGSNLEAWFLIADGCSSPRVAIVNPKTDWRSAVPATFLPSVRQSLEALLSKDAQ